MSDGPRPGAPRAGFRLLRRCVQRRRGVMLLALAGSLGHSAASLATPLVTRAGIDDAVARGGRAWVFALLLLGIAVLRAGFSAARKYSASWLGALVSRDLRSDMFAHLQRLSIMAHNRFGSGQLMSRASSDATVVETTLSGLPFLVQATVMAVGASILLVTIQPLLAAAVVGTVLACAAAPLAFLRPIHRRSRAVQDQIGEVSEFVEQQVRGIRVVRGHGLESAHQRWGNRLIDELRRAGMRLVAMRAWFTAAFVAVPSAATITSLALGGWLCFEGRLTPGGLLAFLQYLGVLVGIVPAVAQVATLWPQALASTARIDQVLRTVPDVQEPANPRPLPEGGGVVELRGVVAGYARERPALDGVDLRIDAGRSLALVGASGSGKSTLGLLVPRFLDPWQGEVLLDGTPVRDLSLSALRGEVAVVFEDGPTLGVSVRENIALGVPTASHAEVEQAAEMAGCDVFVEALPEGYDTVLGEEGLTLSGGQRQRVAIARALLRARARVLILDDVTSALDPDTQASVVEALATAMCGRTTLITSHRTELVRLADEVAVLAAGRVVARGPAAEMLAHPALRAALGGDLAAASA